MRFAIAAVLLLCAACTSEGEHVKRAFGNDLAEEMEASEVRHEAEMRRSPIYKSGEISEEERLVILDSLSRDQG